jgi:hypothetical protein
VVLVFGRNILYHGICYVIFKNTHSISQLVNRLQAFFLLVSVGNFRWKMCFGKKIYSSVLCSRHNQLNIFKVSIFSFSNKKIGRANGITLKTVWNHVSWLHMTILPVGHQVKYFDVLLTEWVFIPFHNDLEFEPQPLHLHYQKQNLFSFNIYVRLNNWFINLLSYFMAEERSVVASYLCVYYTQSLLKLCKEFSRNLESTYCH